MAALTAEHVNIVKATAPVLKEHGTAITKVFYDTMIEENPALRNIFNKTSQANGRQPRALAGAVLAYATSHRRLASSSRVPSSASPTGTSPLASPLSSTRSSAST